MERMTGMLRGDYLGDGLLAVALTVFGQLNLRFNIDGSTRYGPTFATAATTALATAVIALRRRAPLLTVCVVTAAMAAPKLVTRLTITLWGSFVPLVIAVYSVARHEKRRAAPRPISRSPSCRAPARSPPGGSCVCGTTGT